MIKYILKKCPKDKLYFVCELGLSSYYEKLGFKKIKKAPESLIKSSKACAKLCCGETGVFMIEKKILHESFAKTPDLILLDGGRGQLRIGEKMIKKFDLKVPIASIAKGEEKIFIQGKSEPLPIPKDRELSKLFQRLRDEAHRFALNYNKLLRDKEFASRTLD